MGTLYVVRLHKSVIPVVRTGIDTGDMEMWQKKWEFIMLMILGGECLSLISRERQNDIHRRAFEKPIKHFPPDSGMIALLCGVTWLKDLRVCKNNGG